VRVADRAGRISPSVALSADACLHARGPMSFWNEERIKRVVALWRDGHAASAIGRELGCSRNAVIAKLHRLGESQRSGGTAKLLTRKSARPRSLKKRRERPIEIESKAATLDRLFRTEPLPDPDVTDVATVFSVADLENHHCRWPCGTVGEPGFGFCGTQKVTGLPYCAAHARRAFRPLDVKPKREAPARPAVELKILQDA